MNCHVCVCMLEAKMVEPSEDQAPSNVAQQYPQVDWKTDHYRILREDHPVGTGASCKVFRSFNRMAEDDTDYAAKVCSRELVNSRGFKVQGIKWADVERRIHEVEILRECSADCDFIVDFIDAVNAYPKYFKIVLEFAEPLRNLFYHVQMPEADLQAILYCLVSALAHIHRLGIVHGDVKPDNLLYTQNGFVKLCDFGAAWREGIEDRSEIAELGTVSYAAPEILPAFIDGTAGVAFSKKQDIWAAGMVAFRGFYGSELPERYEVPKRDTERETETAWLQFLKTNRIHFSVAEEVDPSLVEFVRECTYVQEPEKRPTAESLLDNTYIAEMKGEACREHLLALGQHLDDLQREVWRKESEERKRREEEYEIWERNQWKIEARARAERHKAWERKQLLFSNPFLYVWRRARGTI